MVMSIGVAATTEAISDHGRIGLIELEDDLHMEVGSMTDRPALMCRKCDSSDTPMPSSWIQGHFNMNSWEGDTKVSHSN